MVYVIAEIGINHNGDINLALNMIKQAHRAGAHCVKFQKRNPEICVPDSQKNNIKIFKGEEMTYLEYKQKIEFGKEEYDKINELCHSLNIDWTVSVWDIDSVNFMRQYLNDIPFIKVPSACVTDIELLKKIDELGIPVVMSTGMSTMEEIDLAVNILSNLIALMHCNSSYPAANNELDLNVIKTFKNWYPHLMMGYSGHEIGYFPTLISIACGAEWIERHFTTDKTMEGTDQKCSLEPHEFSAMVSGILDTQIILGLPYVKVYPSEEKVKQKLRKW